MLEDASAITCSEITALLNVLNRKGWGRFDLTYEPTGVKLLTVNLPREEIINIATDNSFRIQLKEDLLRREVAHFSDLKEALISSGCLPYTNYGEVVENLKEIYMISRDRREVLREKYLAIDTNVAYLHLPSRLFPLQHSPKRYIFPEDYKWVVSEIVWREVDSSIQEKYTPREVERMRRHLRGDKYLHGLLNASTKRSRKAKSALWELNFIRSKLNGFKVPSATYERDKEARDISIARAYSHFARERDVDLLLITADKDMEYHARAEGLPTLLLKMPHEVPRRLKCGFRAIKNLVFELSTSLAFIHFKDAGIVIMGEWAGKGYRELMDQEVLLLSETREGREIIEEVNREAKIARVVEDMLES
ncbi:MAG: hypothetical protein J7L88_01720 [Thermoplasmata archaeon]|nr:hypothetical protein [Thermoplasmata archaeon]